MSQNVLPLLLTHLLILIFQLWMLGYELTDMIIVFCEKQVFILASKKKIEFLKQAESALGESLSMKLLQRDKADKDKANYQKLVDAIKQSKKVRML